MAQQAKAGDTVAIHYTGRLEDGTVFDSSQGRDPLEFDLGSGAVIPGFDQGVQGMEVGEEKEVRIEPENAYGERRDDLTTDVPRSQLPPEMEQPQVGQQLAVQMSDGQQAAARITDVAEDHVTLDLNHPLAGHTLIFDIELVEIR